MKGAIASWTVHRMDAWQRDWRSAWEARLQMDPEWWLVLGIMFAVGICAWVGMRLLDAVGRRAAAESPVLGVLRRVTRGPALLLAPLLAWSLVLSSVPDELPGVVGVRRLVTVSIIFSMTWLLIRAVQAMAEMVSLLRPASQSDNLSARRLHTQTRVISRTLASLIAMLGIALALMTFPQVRHVGASLLASAGLAGIVAGLAARPLLANFIAGIQIGLTQPIRLDDVVIVDGEWGRIEEINGTYVVVAIWDERRLIVPLEWWTQHPFQNWTRNSSQILGSVFLWLDYRQSVPAIRQELERFVHAHPLWDGRVCELEVTDASERAMQVRCLVSCRDSSESWKLRCAVREHLIEFVRANHPHGLPTLRVTQLDAAGDGSERADQGRDRDPMGL